MIVVAVTTLLGRPAVSLGVLALSPALVAAIVTALHYLLLDLRLGAVMAVLLAVAVALGQWLAGMTTTAWLVAGVGCSRSAGVPVRGPSLRRRKPAFVDDVVGLLIGPLFVTIEVVFMPGWRGAPRQAIEERTGPMRRGPSLPAAAAGDETG